jgi:hypothetical protein
MALGHVIFAGRQFPVTAVRLTEGAVRITWVVAGPLPGTVSPVTFFGDDGKGIAQMGEQALPEVPDGLSLALTNSWVISAVSEA